MIDPSDREEHQHTIVIPTPEHDDYVIPLELHGIISYFPTRRPSLSKFDEATDRYELTYETPQWDPSSPDFAAQEANANGLIGLPHETGDGRTISRCDVVPRGSPMDHSAISLYLSDASFLASHNTLAATKSRYRRAIDPTTLATCWVIRIKTARRTIEATTQRGVRTVAHPSLSQRFRTNDRQLQYQRLATEIYADTLVSKYKSRRGNSYAQVFATKFGWCRVFPIQKKSDAHHALSLLFARDSVPPCIIVDGSKEQMQDDFRRKARQADCHIRAVEPHSPWSNAAEAAIRELKRGVGRKMIKSGAPRRLWDHCLELEALIQSNTALDIYELRGQVPETIVSRRETSDISPFVEIGWYDWIMFRDTGVSFPHNREVLGRYLGPSIDIGPAMTAQILKDTRWVVHQSTYRTLTPDELASPSHGERRKKFDLAISSKLGKGYESERSIEDNQDDTTLVETPTYDLMDEDREDQEMQARKVRFDDELSSSMGDNYIGAEVTLVPAGEKWTSGRVKRRKCNPDGSDLGCANANPILDTRVYEVEFEAGAMAEYSANVIAENMWAQCNSQGNQHLLLKEIIDHRRQDGEGAPTRGRDTGKLRQDTRGWKLCIAWKDSTSSWELLKRLKESNPVEVAQYAVAKGIDKEPAFSWWVPHTIKKKERIVVAVNKRYHKGTALRI